jgi:hypothetical protein
MVFRVLAGAATCLLLSAACSKSDTPDTPEEPAQCSPNEGLRLYDERIDPLFREDKPSSCNQCHLSGIDLKQYVRSTPCETYACLVAQDLVDETRPQNSKILSWIERAQPESELITQAVIDAEYSAFLEWISFNAQCDECRHVQCPLPRDAGTFCPDETRDPHAIGDAAIGDAGGCSSKDIDALFRSQVYNLRGRCSPCHFNLEETAQYQAPQWIEVAPDCESGAQKTLANVLRNGYIDFEAPEQSLLLLKPLPDARGGISHGGGDKFDDVDDPGYQSFLQFIEHLVACEASAP